MTEISGSHLGRSLISQELLKASPDVTDMVACSTSTVIFMHQPTGCNPQEFQEAIQDGDICSYYTISRSTELVHSLQDGYFHIVTHPSHKSFQCCVVSQEHFQCLRLTFGLPTAPRVLKKVLVVVATQLWQWGVIIFSYLDNWLLRAPHTPKFFRQWGKLW